MAAKNLNPEEMVQISAGWLDPQNEGNKALLQVPILTSTLSLIQEAHAGVLPLVKPPESPRLTEIMNLEAELDARHDGIIRGTHGALTSMAELLGGDAGDELLALRDALIPEGPQSMLKSYRAEATQAAQLAQRLKPEMRKRTDAIQIGEQGKRTKAGRTAMNCESLKARSPVSKHTAYDGRSTAGGAYVPDLSSWPCSISILPACLILECALAPTTNYSTLSQSPFSL